MIKLTFPDNTWCYRTLHSVHVIFLNENNVLTARTDQPDGRWHDFEIEAFELLEPGRTYT